MMLLPSRDAWLTALQEGRQAIVSYTASDDIGIVVDASRAAAAELGIEIRLWPGDGHLVAEVRAGGDQ